MTIELESDLEAIRSNAPNVGMKLIRRKQYYEAKRISLDLP